MFFVFLSFVRRPFFGLSRQLEAEGHVVLDRGREEGALHRERQTRVQENGPT